MLFIITN